MQVESKSNTEQWEEKKKTNNKRRAIDIEKAEARMYVRVSLWFDLVWSRCVIVCVCAHITLVSLSRSINM